MRVTGIAWTRFRLPLRSPFATARYSYGHREGLLLRVFWEGGVSGVGEASPHPGLGPPALDRLEEALTQAAPALLGRQVEPLAEGISSFGPSLPAALACALETAALDALASSRGEALANLLRPEPRPWVSVNATISAQGVAEAAEQAALARAAGFPCVKLKVGALASLAAERERVEAVRGAIGPQVKLRLDANGAWGYREAVRAIKELKDLGLELVEQPVAPGDPWALARVRREGGLPVAADEDVTGEEAALRLLEAGAVDALVLKPMVLGGLRRALRIADAAMAAGVPSIVTTTIDAGVGTAAALHLAAALGEGVLACGLATGALLAADVIEPGLEVRDGRMPLPAGPGLGVVLRSQWMDALGRPRVGREG